MSLVTVIAFLGMLKLTQALGEAGALSPWWAAWTPNLVFGGAALVLLQIPADYPDSWRLPG
jgi:lipopolysaccharide export LptBFGC system permease protein LptF